MPIPGADLWRWGGTVGRRTYLLAGVSLFLLKFGLDCLVATQVFGREWTPFRYILPGGALGLRSLAPEDRSFYLAMVALAVPFIWIGVGLTLRRLRDVRLPL